MKRHTACSIDILELVHHGGIVQVDCAAKLASIAKDALKLMEVQHADRLHATAAAIDTYHT